MQTITDSPFYRVSVKALVYDDRRRVLMFKDGHGQWEMPGGGWEHGESLQACITRELLEEMGVAPAEIGKVAFVYQSLHEKGYHKVCITVPVQLAPGNFVPDADDLVEARYISPEEFDALPMQSSEEGIKNCKQLLWPETAASKQG